MVLVLVEDIDNDLFLAPTHDIVILPPLREVDLSTIKSGLGLVRG
jgi:hypothetical protein